MKNILLALLLLPLLALSQNEKGVSPIGSPPPPGGGRGEAYAVVVGISDYQDEGIPDLRFADKDAKAFANFLRSPAGGSLDEDHLKVLTNEMATSGELVAALDWLMEVSQEGDQAIIYFSGHGDVESKTRNQLGFLLTWDSPSKAYMAGAYPVFYLQNIIETISLDNKSKVLLITDACRSGKLAGNDIAGNQLTNANLAKQFANEIKILSCQPDEYSIEGEQWGGGRGAFSYHLIEGLVGMADKNADMGVSLSEINRYLEDHVTPEVAPQNQLPMTVGNGRETLFPVIPDLLAQLQQGKKGQLDLFASTDSRGMEDDILASVDSITREKYLLFKKSLKEKVFLEPAGACSDAFYAQLAGEPKLERLHASMRRNYAASLQDEAQQVLNKILNNDVQEISLSKISQAEKYRLYPSYLQRAAELLGEDHYMYPVLQARKLYFEGYLLHIENETPDRELGEQALAKYRAALALQPDFPHPYHSMSAVYFWQLLEPDSAEYYATRAVELAPSWFVPYSTLAYHYMSTQKSEELDKCKHFLELADRVDPSASVSNVWHMYLWAGYYKYTAQYASAEVILKKIVRLDSSFAKGQVGLGMIYMMKGDYKNAEVLYKKTIALDSTNVLAVTGLGQMYMVAQRYAEAEVYLIKAIRLNPADPSKYMELSTLYNIWGRFEAADSLVDKAIKLDPTAVAIYNGAGYSYLSAGRYDEAERLFLKGLQLDPINIYMILHLGNTYTSTAQYEKAEQQFTKALGIDPLNIFVYINTAYMYLYSGHYDKAEQQFDKALQIDPTNSNASQMLPWLYIITGQYDKAKQQINKTLGLDSLDAKAHNNLGFLYAKTGCYVEADAALQKSLAINASPDNAIKVAFRYAILYSQQNQVDAAFASLEQAFKQGMQYSNLKFNMEHEPALAPLMAQTERWDALMEKYSPDQPKN